jgi:hypothetical protein
MLDKKSIIDNELMKEIVSIRIDTLWKMIKQKKENRLPEIDEEAATGKFDNKGAIFIPGGLVYRDVDEQRVRYETFKKISGRHLQTESDRQSVSIMRRCCMRPVWYRALIRIAVFFPDVPGRF